MVIGGHAFSKFCDSTFIVLHQYYVQGFVWLDFCIDSNMLLS